MVEESHHRRCIPRGLSSCCRHLQIEKEPVVLSPTIQRRKKLSITKAIATNESMTMLTSSSLHSITPSFATPDMARHHSAKGTQRDFFPETSFSLGLLVEAEVFTFLKGHLTRRRILRWFPPTQLCCFVRGVSLVIFGR